MSLHQSLRKNKTAKRSQTVKSRWERIQHLQKQDRWKQGDPVYGLPKGG